jgi:ribosome small subunit-dependent GTPase A
VDGRLVVAMRARELGRRGVVVGDRVGIVGDTSGGEDTLARIVRIDERTSVLRRTADDDDTTVEGRQERVVVANADQLVIVSALADPPPRTGFIDRCLVAAYDADIEPLLCLTKADLAGPEEVLAYYTELALPHVLCWPDRPLSDLEDALADRLSVLIGHSGVGKSTLVNRLIPDADRAVGVVSAIGKGRHTSTSVVALPLVGTEAGSWTRPGSGPSASPTSTRTTCCTASRNWSRRRRTVRPTATTWVCPATAASTRWWPRAEPTRAGSPRSGACSPPAPAPAAPTSRRISGRRDRRCASRRRRRGP